MRGHWARSEKKSILLGSRVSRSWQFRKPNNAAASTLLASAAGQAQQHHEQVDKVEVERQCADDSLAACGSCIVAAVVHSLYSLGVVGSETRKNTDAHNRDQPVKLGRAQEEVDHACDDDADQAHKQESAKPRQVTPSGISEDAQCSKRCGCDQEHACDRGIRIDVEEDRERHSYEGCIDEKQPPR